MRVGIIDLGTNSVRFDVHWITPKATTLLHREKIMVRLGQGVFSHYRLAPEAIERCITVFRSFKNTAKILRVDKMVAFGTAALREASDGTSFLKAIKRASGISIQVISGAEEARLIALGVLSHEKIPSGRFGLIDIGGGSTEISICQGEKILHSASFSLGTARLQQIFLKEPRGKKKKNMDIDLRRHIKSTLLSRVIAEGWVKKVPFFYGSSGTVRAVAKILKHTRKEKDIQRTDLKKLVKTMAPMMPEELLQIPGMEPKRIDMIYGGSILLEMILNVFQSKRVRPTPYSLRDGILLEQVQMVRKELSSTVQFHLPEIRKKAADLRVKMKHTDHVSALAGKLFDDLSSVHKLSKNWKDYLIAGCYLHDVGESINPTDYELHSYYVARNADFASLDAWEKELIALLCKFHRHGKPNGKDLEDLQGPQKKAFLKLLALLRVAVAMERTNHTQLELTKVRVAKGSVTLICKSKGNPDLEMLRLEQRSALFQRLFKKRVVLKAG